MLFPSPALVCRAAGGLLLVSALIALAVLMHADRVALVLGTLGYLICGVILSLSSVFGLMARLSITWFQITCHPASAARGGRFLRTQATLLLAFVGLVLLFR